MSQTKPLPMPWVIKIFEKLTLTYGKEFNNRWGSLDLDLVRDDWAHELGMLKDRPESIAFALKNLPASRSPTVIEFRNLCATAPKPTHYELPAPSTPQDPKILAEIAGKLAKGKKGFDHRAWITRLEEREAAGEVLNMNQHRCMTLAKQSSF